VSVDQPTLVVGITLGEPLRALADTPQATALASEADHRLTRVLADLGIPGKAAVVIDGDQAPAPRPLAVRLRGSQIEYPRSLDTIVLTDWRRRRTRWGEPDSGLPTWAAQLAASVADTSAAIIELTAHVITMNAARLLGPAHVDAWRQTAEPVDDRIEVVLQTLLGLGLGIRDQRRITAVLRKHVDLTASDAAELVIEALRPAAIEARVEPAYLAQIATTNTAEAGLFPFLRDGLYTDIGVRLPTLRLVPDRDLPPGCFAIRINDITMPPVAGPFPGECLVNASVEQIAHIAPVARAALNPATDFLGAYVPVASSDELVAQGYTTWDPAQHLVLALADTARAHAARVVDQGVIDRELDLFRQLYPALASSITRALPVSRLTRLLRALLEERVPVRDLRRLFGGLADVAVTGLPESDEALLATARQAAGEIISSRAAEHGAIVAYLVEPSLERDVTASDDRVAKAARESLIAALDAELANLPAAARRPLILVRASTRLAVRRAIVGTRPRMPVLAYEELDPAVNVQPIARLGRTAP
jgi:type III secretory pathway component EscV